MTSLCRSGGSGDGDGGISGSGGGRPSSRCGAVRWGVSGGGRMRMQQRQCEPLTPQQLREWYTSRGGGGGSSGSRYAAVPLGVPGGGLTQLQRHPRETLTPQQLREWYVQRGVSRSGARCPYVIRTGDRAGQTCGTVGHTQSRCFSRLSDTWRAEFGDATELPRWLEKVQQGVDIFALDYDAILSVMYALSASAEGDCYRCVPPDPGIVAASLGASESGTLPGTALAEALHNFTLDSGASRCFFRDSTTLTPLPAPVPIRLADPSGGPGRCPFLHCPFVSGGFVRLTIRSSPPLVHYKLGVRVSSGSRLLLVSPPIAPDSSVALPTGLPLPAMTSWHALPSPCLWSSQVSASHTALACPALPSFCRGAAARHSSFLLVSPDVFSPADSPHGHLRERFHQDLSVLHMHSDRGGEFSSDLLRDFCCGEGILLSFTLPDSLQKNGLAERRIGLVIEFSCTSMIHAVTPHFLWPFAVRYAAHQLNLWPRVSLSETSPTLHWMGEVGDASVIRVWGSRAFVRDTFADKLYARAIPCVFLGFVPDATGWQFYHPTSRRVFPSQDARFDESVPFYRLFPYRSAPPMPTQLFLAPGPPPVVLV
ncbi:unnamed protein product [Closterium sp. NIES-53]